MAETPDMSLPGGGSSTLIIRMSAFGDIICALPTLRALREAFPGARIGWLVDSRFQELVAPDPDLDAVHVVSLKRWGKMVRSPAKWGELAAERQALTKELREPGYEVVLDLQGILKSALVTRMAGSRRVLQSTEDHLGRLQWLSRAERVAPSSLHAVDRMLALAGALGADISRPRFDLFIPDAAREHAEGLFAGHDFGASGPVVALNPGAFARHRLWPAENFAQAARELHRRLGARIVVLGGPGEVALAQGIVRDSGVPVLCTAGQTSYLQLAAVLERCDVAVSGDTGPMHLAVAVGKPVVALFGPANPERTGPFGAQNVVLQKPFPCQPCYSHPTCKDFHCMVAISPDEVVRAVEGVLSRA